MAILLPTDKNEYKHATAVWGDLSSNRETWEKQGGSYMCTTSATAPTLFFYNSTDDAYYGTQVESLKSKLVDLNVDTELIKDYGNGHSVPIDAANLQKIYGFLTSHLNAPDALEVIEYNFSSKSLHCDLLGRKCTKNNGFQIKGHRIIFTK